MCYTHPEKVVTISLVILFIIIVVGIIGLQTGETRQERCERFGGTYVEIYEGYSCKNPIKEIERI